MDELNAPDERYLKMISKGLKETYGMKDLEIKEYLKKSGQWSEGGGQADWL